MGRAKKTKKFATMKRMISASDPRLKDNERDKPKKGKKEVGTHQLLFDSWLDLNLMNTFYTQLSEILCGSIFPELGNSLIMMFMIQIMCHVS